LSPSDNLTKTKAKTPEQKRAFVHDVFETISDDYDRMNDIESFRLHRGWKKALVKQVVAALPVDAKSPLVLDVACGTGDISLALGQALPDAQVVGLDFSNNMLAVARRRLTGLPNPSPSIDFIWGDALSLPFADNSVDALTISFGLRNLPDFEAALKEFARVIKPGGSFFCLEASYPSLPVIKHLFRLYFRYLMPLIAALMVGHRQQYQWLNDSTEVFLSKSELSSLMQGCGFHNVKARSFFFGVAALHQAKA